mmetsp:Transcript_31308/g.88771  ORF Transcript_31308/g.88771 Transcript_31308/m.88771 type:complete len:621 (-) Transcript_31308:70-1932(-)|eukprot:CAMPEP_0117663034 /NCGR_PEP_ID=MMETSP0804-20121206/8370_1 /TAXON_ID=1074897 /ORGANISM="Tetraselmis astigmatica, Strain CCMP880" /LENGTH=620 /DNA_ID=CAMNT_0005469971 /DNA_START=414 /DNA_END=2276 /DNA_ORIENTATION=-
MGVTHLWQLLEPVGRRVNIETLTNKILAIDASIWLVQFIKAMRDDRGEVMRNAHLLGFFRRICRLLFHRVRPVFVFDGATPALKKRTTAARRRQRDQQQAKVRRAAERLLVNRLKQAAVGHVSALATAVSTQGVQPGSGSQGSGGAAAAAPVGGRDEGQAHGTSNTRSSAAAGEAGSSHAGSRDVAPSGLQEALCAADELLAVQLQADEEEVQEVPAGAAAGSTSHLKVATNECYSGATGSSGGAAGSGQHKEGWEEQPMEINSDDESSEDEDEDDIIKQLDLPSDVTELDPAVLSTLPPSVQFEIMQKLREEQFNRNRVKFQAVASNAAAFSETQLSAYLKASAFRRKLDTIRDSQNSESRKLANDAGREYIYHVDPAVAGGGADEGAATAAAGEAAAAKRPGEEETQQSAAKDSGTIEISMEIPAFIDREAFLKLGEEEAAGAQEGAEEEEDVEWEDVDASGAALASTIPTKKPEHWRERMEQRQRFWSRTHGFQFGRKLGDWSEAEKRQPMQRQMPHGSAIVIDGEEEYGVEELTAEEQEDDDALQHAIQASLQAAGAGSSQGERSADAAAIAGIGGGEDGSGDDSDFEWEDVAAEQAEPGGAPQQGTDNGDPNFWP